MLKLSHLVYVEPAQVCEIKVGTFTFTDPQGNDVEAEFYVKTCDGDQSKQVDDYNEQYTDEFCSLSAQGCTNIKYQEIEPCPIF